MSGEYYLLTITQEELRLLSRLYAKVKSDILKETGIEVEGGHVEIYDVYLKSSEDVGTALYYDTRIHKDQKPLREYVTSTDTRVGTQRWGFFNSSGEPLHYRVEKLPDGRYGLYVSLDKAVRKGSRLNIYTKVRMGGKIWMEAPHHRRWLKRGEPILFDGGRYVWETKHLHASLWKMPKGCILFEAFPQPREIYVENDRLNMLYVFYTPGFHKIYMKYLIPKF